MRVSNFVVAALAFSFSVNMASAADSCRQAGAEKYIRDGEAAWSDAAAHHDSSAVKRILADDFVGVSPEGEVYDKAFAISEAEAGGYVSQSEGVRVRFFGNTAIAQGSDAWTQTDGKRGRFVWTDVWVCRGGSWRVVSAEDVETPPKDQPTH
jgi:ketosteroid isomerase-like protein